MTETEVPEQPQEQPEEQPQVQPNTLPQEPPDNIPPSPGEEEQPPEASRLSVQGFRFSETKDAWSTYQQPPEQ